MAASSPLREFSSSRKAKRTWVRRAMEVSRQAGNAALAAAMAASHSSSVAKATWPVIFPVAGFVTGAVRPPGGT